jgi:hypothetical protein
LLITVLVLVVRVLAIFAVLARFSGRISSSSWFLRVMDELSSATAQLRVRGPFALMVGWVVLADASGVELILGAFLAGAIAGLLDQNAAWYPTTFDLLADQEDGFEVRDAVMTNTDLRGKRIRGLRLPGNALVPSIERDGSVLVPDAGTRLKMGERAGAFGSREAVEETIDLLRSRARGSSSAGKESVRMSLSTGE